LTMKYKNKTQARECALKLLYQQEIAAGSDAQSFNLFWEQYDGAALNDEVKHFAETLVEGVLAKGKEVDELITQYSKNWKLSRMTVIDKSVLRLAAYELLFIVDTPERVVLNEAIELAKKFGTEESHAFVNGVLDQLLQDAAVIKTRENLLEEKRG